MSLRRAHLLIAAGALVALAAPSLAQAQTEPGVQYILDTFSGQARAWQVIFVRSATWLFFSIAIIQFVVSNARLALRGADLAEFMESNMLAILGLGVMYAFLTHSYEWSRAFITSFLQLGERAIAVSAPGAGGFDPATIMQNGLIIAGRLFSQISIGGALFAGATTTVLVACAIIVLIAFGVLAAFMIIAIVESYIVLGGLVIFIGFGGASWTSDVAKRALMYALSVGAKLFAMQLVVGISMGAILNYTVDPTSLASVGGILLLTIAVAVLAKSVPDIVQGMLNGASVGGVGTALATVAAVGAAGVAATSGLAASAGALTRSGGPSGGGGGAAAALGASGPGLLRASGHLVDAGAGIDPVRSSRAGGLGGGFGTSMSSSVPPPPPKPPLPPSLGGGSAPQPPSGASGNASSSPATTTGVTAAATSTSGSPSVPGESSDPAERSLAADAGDGTGDEGGTIRAAGSPPPPPAGSTPPPPPGQGGRRAPVDRVAGGAAGAALGFVVGGPVAVPAAAMLGAFYGPELERARAKGRAALAAARIRFGLTPKEPQ